MPLDFLGLEKAQFKPNLFWLTSDLIDPVTGEHRRMSNQRSINSYYEISQDIDPSGEGIPVKCASLLPSAPFDTLAAEYL